MIFPTDQEVDDWMNGISNVKDWAQESKQYILNNWEELIHNPDQVMIMEKKTLLINTVTKVSIDILVKIHFMITKIHFFLIVEINN